jgi:hypothetical protein
VVRVVWKVPKEDSVVLRITDPVLVTTGVIESTLIRSDLVHRVVVPPTVFTIEPTKSLSSLVSNVSKTSDAAASKIVSFALAAVVSSEKVVTVSVKLMGAAEVDENAVLGACVKDVTLVSRVLVPVPVAVDVVAVVRTIVVVAKDVVVLLVRVFCSVVLVAILLEASVVSPEVKKVVEVSPLELLLVEKDEVVPLPLITVLNVSEKENDLWKLLEEDE